MPFSSQFALLALGLLKGFASSVLSIAGIARSGSSGSYSYSVIGNGNHPVAYVSWLDAARFTNWLHNGQPTGLGEVNASTEGGAYTLNGDTTSGMETKNASAAYWIPTEDEWYKAAYYQSAANGGDADGYWEYPTMSNLTPSPNRAYSYGFLSPTPHNCRAASRRKLMLPAASAPLASHLCCQVSPGCCLSHRRVGTSAAFRSASAASDSRGSTRARRR